MEHEGDKKQPYFIHRKDGNPIFMAAIGSVPFERGDETEGFLMVTAAAAQGLVDIHDRHRSLWFLKLRAVGNVNNLGQEMIEAIKNL